MTSESAAVTRARELLAASELEASELQALRELHDAIGAAAESCASGTVALLSLLPFLSPREHTSDFYSDAMSAQALTMRCLLDAQRAASAILTASQARADELLASHSVRV